MKKLILIPFITVLAGCLVTNTNTPPLGTETSTTLANEQNEGNNVVNLEEFKIGELTEIGFLQLVQQRGYVVEKCRSTTCVYEDKKRPRIIKLTQAKKGEVQIPNFKYGPLASTYMLLNYKIGDQYPVEESIIYFYEGKLVAAEFTKPTPRLLLDYKERYPNFERKESTMNAACRIDNVSTKKPEITIETEWFDPTTAISLRHKYGDRLDFLTCKPIPGGYNYFSALHIYKSLELEKYSLKNRLQHK